MGRFSDRWANAGVVALIMTAPWVPLAGVVSFHLIALLTDQPGFSAFARRLLGPYYVVSLAFAALGVFLYSGIAEAQAIIPNQIYIIFSAGSCLFAWGWGWSAWHGQPGALRPNVYGGQPDSGPGESGLLRTGFVAPILASVFLNISSHALHLQHADLAGVCCAVGLCHPALPTLLRQKQCLDRVVYWSSSAS